MRDAAIDSDRQPRRTGASRPASDRPRGDLSSAAIAAQRLGGAIDQPSGRSRVVSRRAAPKRRWGLPSFVKQVRPVKALTTIVFSAALVGVVANAVLFQKGRHAGTPLDAPHGASASAPVPAAKVAAATDAGPTGAVSAPADITPPPAVTSPSTDAAPATAHRAFAKKHALVKTKGRDAIGQLLDAPPPASDKAGVKTAEAKTTEAKTTEAKADPSLLRAQRQLKKLGYAVKPDGRMDGGTRQAIKRFARDHHLKADAALTPELRRQIADASSAPANPAAEPSPKPQ